MPNFPKWEFVKKKFAQKKGQIFQRKEINFQKRQIPQKMKKFRQMQNFPKKEFVKNIPKKNG